MRSVVALLTAFCILTANSTSARAEAPDSPDATAAKLLAIPAFKAKLEADKPLPTGDALFDRYAAEIWQRNAPRAYFADGDAIETAACLPDDVLAGWEPEFGYDPRYWQLRYFSARALKATAEADVEDLRKGQPAPATYSGPDPVSFLQHAVDIHVYDVATLKALFEERLTPLLVPGPKVGPYNPPHDALKPGGAEVLRPIAEKLVAEFPQESDSWYTRALVDIEQDDEAGALADLKQGNAALSNRYICVFPESTVLDGIIKGAPPGSRYVSGMVLMGRLPATRSAILVEKKLCNRLRDATAKSLDFVRWQPVYDWTVRQALRKGDDALIAPMLFILSSNLAGQLLTETPDKLTEDQRSALVNFIRQTASKVKGDTFRIMDEEPQIEDMLKGMLGDVVAKSGQVSNLRVAQLLLLRLFNSSQFQADWFQRDFGWAAFTYMCDGTAFENGKLRDKLIEQVQYLAKWDWAKLDYTQTPEELQQDQAFEEMAKRVQAGDLSLGQAVTELGKTKTAQPGAPAPNKPEGK